MEFNLQNKSEKLLQKLYIELLKPRLIEEKMLILLRQGRISKWFSGIGQEAISVGTVMAMDKHEYILPMHRNLGIFTGRGMDLEQLISQLQGKYDGFSKGRERSFHFGSQAHNIVGMISHLGPQLGIADGIALANLLKGNKQITAVFSGDGGTSQGDFHEAMNVAAVWNLPVIFIIENNGYGLSTPSSEQFKCERFIDKCKGYGIDGKKIDGNNILEVYDTIQEVRKDIKTNPRPFLIECMTFRMRGHEEASGTKYVPQELMDTWAEKDPIKNYEEALLKAGILYPEEVTFVRNLIKEDISKAVEKAFAKPEITPNTTEEFADVYAPHKYTITAPSTTTNKVRFIDAISDALRLAMQTYPNLILMGQDIAEYGGVFKVTEGFVEKFGKKRVRNTPLCESAIVGTALGLSINGYKSMVEMQFADFVTCGFNQIVNNLAKIHYRWGEKADVVIRMPTGAGVGAGPFHSQSNESWFFHTPGLKIVYPAFPADAKGLLLSAFEDPNPVLFFEHKALYRSLTGEVPVGYYTIPIGKAATIRKGNQVSIITYGMGVHWALQVLDKNPQIKADVIDLRTLVPLDWDTIFQSAQKTGKILVLHEDTLMGGIGAEIAAQITEKCFNYLDAPVKRCASLDTPVPFSTTLENNFLAKSRLEEMLLDLVSY